MSRAGALPELNSSNSNSIRTFSSVTVQRLGWTLISTHGRNPVETIPRGEDAGAGDEAGAGDGDGASSCAGGSQRTEGGGGVEDGPGSCSRGTNTSTCGPPANAGRDRLRQKRKAPPASNASKARIQGIGDRWRAGTSAPAPVPSAGAGSARGACCGRGAGIVGNNAPLFGGVVDGASAACFGVGAGASLRVAAVESCSVRRPDARALGPARTGSSFRDVAAGRSEAVDCGTCSAGRVTVPCRLKFCSSRGPTASAGALVTGAGASWPNAGSGASASPTVKPAIVKRRAPRIVSPPLSVSRAIFPRRDRHMPTTRGLFKHSVDEPVRNLGGYWASTSTSSASSSAWMSSTVSPVMATPSRGPASTPFTRTRPLGTK